MANTIPSFNSDDIRRNIRKNKMKSIKRKEHKGLRTKDAKN